MINPIWLLTSFRGRIGRMAWWFGLIVLVLASPFSITTALSQNPFADAIATIQTLGWVGAAWTLFLFIPLAALNTKRLHDLGKSGLRAVLFYAPAAAGSLKLFVGDTPAFAQFEAGALWLALAVGATGLWFLVRLGFYSGTRGANKYGDGRGSRSGR